MWDQRYAGDEYLFGTAPAQFLREQSDHLTPGQTALCVADGEGRNSVFLAEQGLAVTAMDSSVVAVEKASRLASDRGVSVNFHVADIGEWDWDATSYDVVVAIFIQFLAPADRTRVFDGLIRALAPGGLLLLHGYRPPQVDYGTGGPPERENMYTESLLRAAFGELTIELLRSYEAHVDEGRGHSGRSALIDLVARRP